MKRFTLIATLVVIPFVTLMGCDYLPEAISGRPDPNAEVIQAAGPSGSSAASQKGTSPAAVAWNPPAAMQNGVTTAEAESAYEVRNEVVPTAATEATPQPSTYTSLALPIEQPAGLAVPPAVAAPTLANGTIIIQSAFVRFRGDLDLEVAAPADGLIMEMNIEEGDTIAAGDLICQIDDRLARSELEVTNREYEAADEKAKDKSEIEYAEASTEVADEDFKITEKLEQSGASNKMELTKKWLELKRANLGITVAQVKNRQDKSAVGVAKAKQGAAGVQIELRKILAPFEGIVAEKKKERYDWTRAGDVILRLISMEKLRVVGSVQLSQLTKAPHELLGSDAIVDIEIFPGSSDRVQGKVGFVSPLMDASNSYKVWIDVSNKKSNGQWLFRDGMSAKVQISAR